MFKDMEYDLRALLNAGLAYSKDIQQTKQFLYDVETIVQQYKNRIANLEMSIIENYEGKVKKNTENISVATNP